VSRTDATGFLQELVGHLTALGLSIADGIISFGEAFGRLFGVLDGLFAIWSGT
jgi:hypothetical protein